MLFLTAILFTEFYFFKKGQHIAALERSDAEKSAQLVGEG